MKTDCLSLLKTSVDSQYGPIILCLLYIIKCYVLKYISIYTVKISVISSMYICMENQNKILRFLYILGQGTLGSDSTGPLFCYETLKTAEIIIFHLYRLSRFHYIYHHSSQFLSNHQLGLITMGNIA